jgi:hypothetical protein
MTAAASPTLPGRAPEFPAAGAPAQPVPQALREIFDFGDFLKEVANPKALDDQKALISAYDSAVRALVGENDVQVDKGREFKKKSAWKKLARHFRIDVFEVEHRVFRDEYDGELIAECRMRGVAPWGQQVEAVGACTTYEKRFKYDKTKAWHDCLATAQTRASNRVISDLIAAGEVSAEEADQHDREDAPEKGGEKNGEQRDRKEERKAPDISKMTLEDALKLTLRGKEGSWGGFAKHPFSEVPYNLLVNALDFFKKLLTENPEDLGAQIDVRAITLVIDSQRAHEEAKAAAEKEARDGADMFQQAGAVAPQDSPAGNDVTSSTASASASPSAARIPTVPELMKLSPSELRNKVLALLENPVLAMLRADTMTRIAGAFSRTQYATLIIELMTIIAGAVETERPRNQKGELGVLPGEFDS